MKFYGLLALVGLFNGFLWSVLLPFPYSTAVVVVTASLLGWNWSRIYGRFFQGKSDE